MKIHILVASVFGIGFVGKGGGTVASIVFCLVWYFLPAGYENGERQLIVMLLLIGLGTWSSGAVDLVWGKDNKKVVIDEVAGMAITLLYVPRHLAYLGLSLVVFRFFDIVKPLGIRQAEQLPKGWGVMADDILAGIYAMIIIQLSVLAGNQFG